MKTKKFNISASDFEGNIISLVIAVVITCTGACCWCFIREKIKDYKKKRLEKAQKKLEMMEAAAVTREQLP